jgi:ubiquinone biosynthesis protein
VDAARRSLLADAEGDSNDYPAVGSARPPRAPLPEGRPPRRGMRFIKAYWTTFRVIVSYLWLRFWARWRSDEWVDRELRSTHLRNAKRIERTICELQGLFIKVGQVISIMTNFLPEEFRRQLEGLQDHVPPRPYPDIAARIREELGGEPDAVFASFDKVPIASASIGQVHRARLHTGEDVAVKVQYPDIDEIVSGDLRTMRRIFRIVQWFVPYQGLDDVYREIRAHRAGRARLPRRGRQRRSHRRQLHRSQADVAFPRVVRERSTARVLTTRFEAGVKISDNVGTKQLGLDRRALARQVVEVYCQQIFTDGVYHADPHPGNLLVRPAASGEGAAELVFLDFGAVATISPEFRQGIIELVQGGSPATPADRPRDAADGLRRARRRRPGLRAGHRVLPRPLQREHLARHAQPEGSEARSREDLREEPREPGRPAQDGHLAARAVRELPRAQGGDRPRAHAAPAHGPVHRARPDAQPDEVIRPYLERFVLGDSDWSAVLVDTSRDVVMSVASLPGELRRFLRLAHAGDLRLRVANLDTSSQLMYRLGHQAIFAAVGIAGGAFALVLEGRGELDRAGWGWWTARVCGALMVWSWWSSRGLLRRKAK